MNLLPIPTTGIVRCLTAALVAFALASTAAAQSTMPHGEDGLPAWVADVGALSRPTATEVFSANEYGAVGDGETTSTEAIQAAIDAAAEAGGGIVTFQPGTYLTGAIFVKSNVHLRVDEGVTLLGTQSESAYPVLWTRVAGIEMEWPAALINVYDSDNVMISGGGTIDGNGEVW